MTDLQANVVGFAGTFCIIFAYAYQTAKRVPNPYIQHGINLLGAVLLGISLLVHMNVASLVLEVVWAGVAIWGLAKAMRSRQA